MAMKGKNMLDKKYIKIIAKEPFKLNLKSIEDVIAWMQNEIVEHKAHKAKCLEIVEETESKISMLKDELEYLKNNIDGEQNFDGNIEDSISFLEDEIIEWKEYKMEGLELVEEIDDIINSTLPNAISELKEMKADGVKLMRNNVIDGYIQVYTTDPKTAGKYGFLGFEKMSEINATRCYQDSNH